MLSLRQARSKGVIPLARAASSGVVRIVKPMNTEAAKHDVSINANFGAPLINQVSTPSRASGHVGPDVRVADLFRQYKRNPDKTKLIFVLENLCVMGIDASVLCKFPGFIQLVDDLSVLMHSTALTPEETLTVIAHLGKIGLKSTTHGTGVNFAAFEKALSSQLVSILDKADRYQLVKCVYKLEDVMKIHLDRYFYWALNKEITAWATDNSVADTEYVRDVLGSLQLLAQPSLAHHMTSLLADAAVENRVIDSIKDKKLTNVQIIELVHNIKGSQYSQLVQMGIASVLSGFRPQLETNIDDLSHLVSALPADGTLRDPSVQKDLGNLLLSHLRTESSSEKIGKLLTCVSDLVVDASVEIEILEAAAQLVSENTAELNRMNPDKVANLYFLYSVATVNKNPILRDVCRQLESVVVGRLPKLSAKQLSRLSLSFASGVVSNASSFKALGATIKRSISEFSPAEYVAAVYGLAYRGLITKSVLAEANLEAIVRSVPVKSLTKLAWSIAVAGLSAPAVWDNLITRIDKQILSNSKMLTALSGSEESMLYEVLVTTKVNNHAPLSKGAERRISQFESSWSVPVEGSDVDYGQILGVVDIAHQQHVDIKDKLRLYQLPIFIPEYKLVLDVTKAPVSEQGLTNGSSKLRHSLWSKLGYNVIAISDSQYEPDSSIEDKASIVGSIISQFVSEIDAVKVQPNASTSNRIEWDSRRRRNDVSSNNDQTSWGSREESKIARQSIEKNSKWTSRLE